MSSFGDRGSKTEPAESGSGRVSTGGPGLASVLGETNGVGADGEEEVDEPEDFIRRPGPSAASDPVSA